MSLVTNFPVMALPSAGTAVPPLLDVRGLQRLHIGPVNLQLAAGECVALMGASGAGKSVVLRMMADLDPHAGDVWLAGQACSAMPAPQWRRQVTYVAADSGWWDDAVAAHFPLDYDFERMLPAVGIVTDARHWAVARLSTGERQRMALLRAMQPQTRVLLLDEPTSGLDEQSAARVENLLLQFMQKGGAVLLVTHQAEQAVRLAQRHFHIAEGRLYEGLI